MTGPEIDAPIVRADRPRLWVVSELYYPEETSTGYFLTRIAEGLASDLDVRVIAAQPSYSQRGTLAPRYERRNGTIIHRIWATHFNKDNLVLRLLNLITFSSSVILFALWHFRKGDQALVVTNPPTVSLILGPLLRWKRVEGTLLVHDVYPEFLVATGFLNSGSALHRLLQALFDASYRQFLKVVVLGRDMLDIVSQKTGDRECVSIIPNWGDTDEVFPYDKASNPFRQENGLSGKFVVQFSGNIGRSHDIELVLATAKKLQLNERIIFVFVGYGGKSELVREASRRGHANLVFLDRQPREKLGQMLASSDVTVISFVEGMYGLSVPSRMYNIMAAGVPILASAHPQSELGLVVEEEKAGWVIEEPSVSALSDLIEVLASTDNDEAAERGQFARNAAEQRYSFRHIIEMYRRLFRT